MTDIHHTAPSIWKKLKQKKSSMLGLCIIIIALIICIFGYIIAPDASTDADLQTVEIQSKPVGYTQQFLKILINNNTEQSFFW